MVKWVYTKFAQSGVTKFPYAKAKRKQKIPGAE